ncbi:A disintegrin and metalloproteinase with thrombospondin motifs 20 [Pseudorasbora parva]|uniref:A disintegrin and metalloproteinase with thrombospondin motifs 20 n=1 Tax=Pseudorasbora parva TaxID=51549 RepID=UPI00351F2B42
MCVNKEMDIKPVHGEWGPWGPYSVCSRTCGGGTRSTARDCNKPEPRNGGRFCVGRRMKFRSCNTDPCPRGRRDFREEQCAQFDGKHFNINGLPPSVRWVPKYSGIVMKDRCKLFCRVTGTMAYYQLRDRVVDGTPCGPDTYDICVQGLCRQAGCDHVLNSKARNDKCGVCGGDNSSCKTLAGTFNNAQYGYNVVVRIPAGATNIDIKQVSYSGLPEDDNYLALSDSQSNFLLNGNFVVSMFKREITFKGAEIEYSGSNTTEERINCTQRIEEELVLQVLCVGNLYNPDVRYSFSIPIEEQREQFVWDPSGSWQECSRVCQGERRRKAVCVRKSDHLVVSEQRCEYIPRPRGAMEPCNSDCELRWHVAGRSDCSSKCGPGHRTLDVVCMRYSQSKRLSERVESRACTDLPKPQTREACHGDCLLKSWQYSTWSQCSKSCGRGVRTRQAFCMNNLGRRLVERECDEQQRVVSEPCSDVPCPDWSTSQWSECLATCGKGVRHRQVQCILGDEHLSEARCDPNTKPSAVGSCELPECASWQIGGWSTCTVSCGQGYQRRAVRCVSGAYGETMDDRECNAAAKPQDSQDCELSVCPHAVFNTPRPAEPGQRHTQWRYGSWTTCSVSCGEGRRERYVSCRDAQGGVAEDSSCAHLSRPADTSVCFSPCGQWREGEWTPCSVSCGVGRATRRVVCMNHQHQLQLHESLCHPEDRPSSEQECVSAPCQSSYHWPNNQPYLPHDPRSHPGHHSWNIPSADNQWRTGPWGACSSSCEAGFQRRVVVCQDADGRSTNHCDERVKPDQSKRCDSGPCPHWNYGIWGECTRSCGGGQRTRLVVCQRPNGQRLNEHNCDMLDKPADMEPCNSQACTGSASWHRRAWKP